VDVVSWDHYPEFEGGTNKTFAEHQLTCDSLAKTRTRGKAYAISELGFNYPSTRPGKLRDVATWTDANGALFVDYFDYTGSLGDHRLTDEASRMTWQQAIDDAFAPGPTLTPTLPASAGG
jgi:hypothetical protein